MSAAPNTWKRLPWPWEIEVLIVGTVLAFVVYSARMETISKPEAPAPVVAEVKQEPETERDEAGNEIIRPEVISVDGVKLPKKKPTSPVNATSPQSSFTFNYLQELNQTSWILIVLAFLTFHFLLARASTTLISTPIWMIIAPPLFALLSYCYLFASYGWNEVSHRIIQGTWSEAGLLVLVYFGIAILLARVRMQRTAVALRDEQWIAEVPASPISDLKMVIARLQPLVYPPNRFLISENGIIIRGWHFIALLPYKEIESISRKEKGDLEKAGFYLTRSFKRLIQIKLRSRKEPVIIGPDKSDYFLAKTKLLKSSSSH